MPSSYRRKTGKYLPTKSFLLMKKLSVHRVFEMRKDTSNQTVQNLVDTGLSPGALVCPGAWSRTLKVEVPCLMGATLVTELCRRT